MPTVADRSRPAGPRQARDTIVAASSPPGRSRRGLVRLSGPEVLSILGQLIQPPETTVQGLATWPQPRRLVPCRLRFSLLSTRVGPSQEEAVLPALVTLFLGPSSYSGQDMAEIQTPGHPAVLDRLIQQITRLGARLAEPGEFTFRAFLAGKLDLTQAEGVAATISAVSDTQLQAATLLRQGRLGRLATDLADGIAGQLALVEAGIDFVDQDDVVTVTASQLANNLKPLMTRLRDLLERSALWHSVESLPRVVLAGEPNSGKSTLFNALLGQQRAVVSPAANTTRDVLAEPLMLHEVSGNQLEVMLVDVAGIDAPVSALDRQAQAAAREAIQQADMILLTCDGSTPPTPELSGSPVVSVRTKVDLAELPGGEFQGDGANAIAVSSVTGQGLDQLRAMMAHRLRDRGANLSGERLVLQRRHEQALRNAYDELVSTLTILDQSCPDDGLAQPELIAVGLRQALDELASLAGQMTPEDVLGRVFATFCIGK